MTLLHDVAMEAATRVDVATSPDGLAAIRHPGCAATIWQRQPLTSFQAWIDAQPPEVLPRARIMVQPHLVGNAVTEIMDASGLPACAERSMLVDDIAALADVFSTLLEAPYLRLRLDVVTSNMCRKFHVDAVTARLLCTYRGTGTQYGVSTNGDAPSDILTVPTGAPILLRGTRWPGSKRCALLHRSPPIEGTGETRLMVVLDPVAEVDQDNLSDQPYVH